MKPRLSLLIVAFWVFASTVTSSAEEFTSRLPNLNDPADRKAVIAVVRAAKAVGTDLKTLRLVVSPDCGCGGAYAGQGLFIADESFLNLPQWALDAVMAHEMGHAMKRHVETGALRDVGIIGALTVLGALVDKQSGAETGAAVGKLAVTFTRPKFTQAQEYEADHVGVQILRKEGYKEAGNVMANMMNLFLRDARGGGWFDSHPSTPDRIRRVQGR
jgi:Zn-dependent protease with chaperone function